jgi:hypothetical protein
MTKQKLRWENPDWLQQASEWIHVETDRQGLHLIGPIEQPHVYPWSTVLRMPTTNGTVFFKATAPETIFEAGLTHKLAGLRPDCLPELIAVDTTRGWLLMRDGGEPLRAAIRPTRDLTPWNPVISLYAELQVELAHHVEEFIALGVPDCRLAALPAIYANLLADEASLLIDQPKGLTSAEVTALQALTPRFKQICAELATCGVPASLNQGDFHDGNTLLRNGRITFFDWGDANVTHPFVSLRTCFVSIEIALELDDYSFTPEMAALLDRYLVPWQAFASKEKLLSAYRYSKPVAAIVKAFSWHQTIAHLPPDFRADYEWILPEVWKEFMIYEKRLAG